MPGLAIILTEPGRPELAASLARMLAALAAPADQPTLLVLPDMGIAIGHVECPAFRGAGPARRATSPPGEAADVSAVLEGELPDAATLAERLGLPPTVAPAELIATLYAREGAAALENLSGHWAVAIVDRGRSQVVIANDAFGVRPLYRLWTDDGAWLLASHPAALLAYPGVSREVEPAGLADMLAFGYVLGRKTLFRRVELLPAATLLTWADGALHERRYWLPAPQPASSFTQADLETIRELFNESVVRLAATGGPLGVALSGGLDSRTILSALVAAGIFTHTTTHSVTEATDARLSARLAGAAGAPHHFHEVKGELLADRIGPGVRLLGSQVANVDVHPLCFLDDMAGFARAMFTGLGGGLYQLDFGGADLGPQPGTGETAALVDQLFPTYNRVLNPQGDFTELLRRDWLQQMADQPRQSVVAAVESALQSAAWNDASDVVYLQERVRKFLTKGDALVRAALETRHPFMDRRLLTRVWSLPKSARVAGQIHRYIVTRNAPALADVPYERDGLPIRYPFTQMEHWRQAAARAWRRTQRRLGWPYRAVHNYRYAEWLRGPLRPLFEETLLDPRTMARPYFRPETVKRWLAEHMAGRDHTLKLSTLLSLELTMRYLVDGDVIASPDFLGSGERYPG